MRLTVKLFTLILLGIIALLAIDGYLLARRGIELFDNDMERDAKLLGHTIKELVSETWQANGQKEALKLIKAADRAARAESGMEIRWVWLDDSGDDAYEPLVPRAELGPVLHGLEMSVTKRGLESIGYRYTYVPISVGSEKHAALEISESLSELADYSGEIFMHSFVLVGLMGLASWLWLRNLGLRLVARPLEQLMEMTRRIAAGDLSGQIVLDGKDELSDLATALNQMCERLAVAQETIQTQIEARIAALDQMRHTERLATLGRLSSGMAHELGTPLNVVGGTAKLIATADLNKQEIIDCAKTIGEQTERMTKIIRQLLNFARRRVPQRAPANIESLARQVLDMLDPAAQETHVTFKLVTDADIRPISVDRSQIQQVLINLVMNGIQAMPNGGLLELGFHLEHARDPARKSGEGRECVAIYVKDEGAGMTGENVKLIFEPFFTTKKGKGTGLGLSIAHGIIDEHGGWIDVKSELGKGSCFTIYLPVETSA